jgi:uncharacterized repeat protein (TIGR03803 family)
MAKTKQDGFPFSAIPRGKDLSLLWLACALAVIGIAPARAQTTEIVLHNFPGPAKATTPYAGVIRDSAGNLYGTTVDGGTANEGAVYRVDTAGHRTVLYSFTGGADGSEPHAGVIRDPAGNLYGTTYAGGTAGVGVVYMLDPAGHETVLHSFTGGADGRFPEAGVIRDSAGNLYGTTSYGGVGAGVVYKLDATGHETVLYTFPFGPDGNFPTGGVILDSAGNLYGTTYQGGTSGQGLVYKLDPAGNETVLYNFAGLTGEFPYAGVVRDSAGNLYGTTPSGGTLNGGVVYKLDTAGQATVLYNFDGRANGGNPVAGVTLDSAGNLYGTTRNGGTVGRGVVYKLDTGGKLTVLYSFTGGADGGFPYNAGLILDSAGNLYGTTIGGGRGGAGVVYKVDSAGRETALYTFPGADGENPGGLILDSAGNLYGTTSGGARQGVLYKLDATGHETLLYAFGNQFENDSSLTLDAAGNFYGTIYFGGPAEAGQVFKLDTHGLYKVLYNFTGGADGKYPSGLIRDAEGNLYGIANEQGAANGGVVFKLAATGKFTVLYSFTPGPQGFSPIGVTVDPVGNLYGTTSGGGTGNSGVVFKLDAAGNYSVLYNFTGGGDGGPPDSGVIRDSADNLYGTSFYGSVVFKVDTAGHETVLYSFTGGADGGSPTGGVVGDSAGNLYGTTAYGGASNKGVVYKLDAAGHETVLHSFTGGADGGGANAVILDPAGNLYGTAFSGGTSVLGGLVFKLLLH